MDQKRTRKTSRKRKPNPRLRFLIIGLCALLAAGGGYLLFFSGKPDLADSVVSLPFQENDSHTVCDTGIAYYKDGVVHVLDASGNEIWYTNFSGEDVKLALSQSLVAVYSPSLLKVYDMKGKMLFQREFLGTVCGVSCSDTLVCVYRKAPQGSDMNVLDASGADVNTVDLGAQSAVAFGVDDALKMIWILTLDTSADTPVSRISTYTGGSTISGLITVDTHLVKSALFTADEIYALGSTHVMCYDYKGVTDSSQMVYGWNIQDAKLGANGKPLLVLTPPLKEGANTFEYPIARLISYGASETLIPLPSECFQILLENDRIYCFTPGAVSVYTLDGQQEETYPLGITIDRVALPVCGSHVLAFSGRDCYLVPLP